MIKDKKYLDTNSEYPEKMEKKDTRSGFGEALYELGKMNKDIVALCADLTDSLKMTAFANAFPDRFIEVGIAEANMMGIAAGLATLGKIPFAGTFANFATARVYDQIRQSIAYSNKNVKIVASHHGLTLGEDGATHQNLEDWGMMKMLPNMTIVVPCDYNQSKTATFSISEHYGPVYFCFGRPKWPVFTNENEKFEIGKAQILKKGKDTVIFSTGHLVWESLEAAKKLQIKGIDVSVVNIHTIKPLDEECILDLISTYKSAVVAEEHQLYGGLGESIAALAAKFCPVNMEFVGIKDVFGESGKPFELLKKYNIDSNSIVQAVIKLLSRQS